MVIDTQQSESPTATSRVGLRWGPETLEVRDQEVFGTGDADLCRRFLHRVFSVDEVKSVQIDRRRSSAVIRYERGGVDWPNCSSGWPRRSAARWESELNHRASASCPETSLKPSGRSIDIGESSRHGESLAISQASLPCTTTS